MFIECEIKHLHKFTSKKSIEGVENGQGDLSNCDFLLFWVESFNVIKAKVEYEV